MKLLDRRGFLCGSALFGATAAAKQQEEEVSPGEDLMQEHGVLKRVLLVYKEAMRRIDENRELPLATVSSSARIIQNFVENYHEKNEEDYLFPRFRKAGKLVELVDVLYDQHQKGRAVTTAILSLARDGAQKRKLRDAMHQFVRMYEPHEAREDTVLFPAFRKLVSRHEYDAMGEMFEKSEHRHLGADGFEKVVDEVAGIEKQLGIYDLAQFTPKVTP